MCGAAADVPDAVAVAVSDPMYAERISLPGAKMSTSAPQFEKLLRVSSLCMLATQMALGARAGE